MIHKLRFPSDNKFRDLFSSFFQRFKSSLNFTARLRLAASLYNDASSSWRNRIIIPSHQQVIPQTPWVKVDPNLLCLQGESDSSHYVCFSAS